MGTQYFKKNNFLESELIWLWFYMNNNVVKYRHKLLFLSIVNHYYIFLHPNGLFIDFLVVFSVTYQHWE